MVPARRFGSAPRSLLFAALLLLASPLASARPASQLTADAQAPPVGGATAPCEFEQLQASVYHYWSSPSCDLGSSDKAAFRATFRSVNNDAYTVITAWCAYPDLQPEDLDEHCVFRSSDYFVGNLDYEVSTASINDKYKKNFAYLVIQCKNIISTCQIKVIKVHIMGPETPAPLKVVGDGQEA